MLHEFTEQTSENPQIYQDKKKKKKKDDSDDDAWTKYCIGVESTGSRTCSRARVKQNF